MSSHLTEVQGGGVICSCHRLRVDDAPWCCQTRAIDIWHEHQLGRLTHLALVLVLRLKKIRPSRVRARWESASLTHTHTHKKKGGGVGVDYKVTLLDSFQGFSLSLWWFREKPSVIFCCDGQKSGPKKLEMNTRFHSDMGGKKPFTFLYKDEKEEFPAIIVRTSQKQIVWSGMALVFTAFYSLTFRFPLTLNVLCAVSTMLRVIAMTTRHTGGCWFPIMGDETKSGFLQGPRTAVLKSHRGREAKCDISCRSGMPFFCSLMRWHHIRAEQWG